MKKLLFILMLIAVAIIPAQVYAQQINLGGAYTPIQVRGTLQQAYGGTGTNVSIPSCHGTNNALIWNDAAVPPQFQCSTISGGGSGTVTNVSPYGTNNMFVMTVANQSTTPQISIALSDAINTVFVGSGAGTGAWATIPGCNSSNTALNFNNSTHTFSCGTITGGVGTVTNVSPSGTNNMFVLSVANQTSTPQISVALSNAINQVFVGTGSGSGAWATLSSCSGANNALTYNNSTQTFGCNTISGGGGGTTTNPVTFAASGGAAPGVTFNGSVAITADYHTVGAAALNGSNATGSWPISITGSAFSSSFASALSSAPSICPAGQWAYGIASNGNAICGSANATITLPSGSPISAATCTSVQTQALTGVRSTSAFDTGFGSNPLVVTGWGANGGLVVEIWPDVSNDIFDWAVCNQSSITITPGAMTLNVGVK